MVPPDSGITSPGAGSDLQLCADLVRSADLDRFRAAMAAPSSARQVLFPLYALNVEIARAPWAAAEPMIAEMRLQWWRDALAEIAAGRSVRRHSVTTSLAAILSPEFAARLDAMVAVRRWDIYRDPFEDKDHFAHYIDETAGTLLWIATCSLGRAAEAVIRDAAFAQGLTNWFRAVPALEARGRIPLVDGRAAAIRELAAQGLERLARARARRGEISYSAAPALLAVWQAGAVLTRVRDDPERVRRGDLVPGNVRDRIALAMRAMSGRW